MIQFRKFIITLKNKEDLEEFYEYMENQGHKIALKRPLSRNTHYWLTREQAEDIKKNSRVESVIEDIPIKFVTYNAGNYNSYTISGNFWKDDTVGDATIDINDFQWGHLHCLGSASQRRKGTWGSGSTDEIVTDSVTMFNDGKHVDVVIVDDPVSYDCEEWNSPTTGLSRFVQYQWFNELNQYVSNIDDDLATLPTGTITYYKNSDNPQFHGVHVTGTVAGQHYGWAREANIYNLTITAPFESGQIVDGILIFDYLRAFHKNKPINPATGFRNPTVTNHSYGSSVVAPNFSSIEEVQWDGTTYTKASPNPSGWSVEGFAKDFRILFNSNQFDFWSSSIAADVKDAVDEGIVVIGACGNSNNLIESPDNTGWNNKVKLGAFTPFSSLDLQGAGTGYLYTSRGSSPNTPDSGSILVAALNNTDNFTRATYTNYGPGVDVFSPGTRILSSYNSTGLADGKYSTGNYFYPLNGTSMASPQVAGIAACLATGKRRFTNGDVRGFISKNSVYSDMTFDAGVDLTSISMPQVRVFVKSDNTIYFCSQDETYNLDRGRQFREGLAPGVSTTNPTYTMYVNDYIRFYPNDATFDVPPSNPSAYEPESQTAQIQLINLTGENFTSSNYLTLLSAKIPDGFSIGINDLPEYLPPIDSNDRVGNYEGKIYTFQAGDEISFNLNVAGNIDDLADSIIVTDPQFLRKFYVVQNPTDLIANEYTIGVYRQPDVLPSGGYYREIFWDTTSVAPGTYYVKIANNNIDDFYLTINIVSLGTYKSRVDSAFYLKSSLGPGNLNKLTKSENSDYSYNEAGFGGGTFRKIFDFIPFTAGTYYFQYAADQTKYATIQVLDPDRTSEHGTFSDKSCQKGSPDRYLHAESMREQNGLIQETRGSRKPSGQVFPRQSYLY